MIEKAKGDGMKRYKADWENKDAKAAYEDDYKVNTDNMDEAECADLLSWADLTGEDIITEEIYIPHYGRPTIDDDGNDINDCGD